jgi:cytochrome c-type biogenesis protein
MITLLLFTAGVLGLLAFFEPCTIASHTLYSVKTYREAQAQTCCQTIIFVWLSRTLLLITLFMSAVLVSSPPDWGETVPSIVLSLMAVIYLVSRFIYLPIPNLEFYRLIPGGKQLPHSIHLGLTLPACTIPLVVIVTGMSVMADSVVFAALAGIVFSSFFTAPMALILRRGLQVYGLDILNRAAKGSPYLTAVLLFSLALYL